MIYVSTAGVSGRHITERVSSLAEAGVTHIELSGGSSYYDHKTLLSDLKKLQQKYNLQFLLHNYFPPPENDFVFNLASSEDEIVEKSISHATTGLMFSKELGAEKLGFHAGFLVDADASELDGTFKEHSMSKKDQALERFFHNIDHLQSVAGQIRIYFENNVLTQSNLQVYHGVNPFLLSTYADYLEMKSLYNFNILLDVAHLQVTAATLDLNFNKELDSFLDVTDYLHFSQNNGIDDTNSVFDPHDPIWEKISTDPEKDITLEISARISDIAELYSRLHSND